MADPQSHEALFLENLSSIDRIAGEIARRHYLRGEDLDDFKSWIRLCLLENDYAVLRKFRGESALNTYLTVVIVMLARDYRYRQWGRWRPSAEARRRGELAVRLETLVRRDGYGLDQAAELLRTSGATSLTDRQLTALLAELPARAPLRPIEVGAEGLPALITTPAADEAMESVDRERSRSHATRELEAALENLPIEDRTIVRLRFWSGSSIAEISRGLGLEQKQLYKRFERVLRALRQRLARAGIGRDEINDLLHDDAAD